ncbi:transcriptional regulator [bacterium]|nr:transcriptional regulator [bacterium]
MAKYSLDKRIHEPVRLAIMVQLVAEGPQLRFTHLRDILRLTQGNLASHLRVLEAAGFVSVEKRQALADAATYVRITGTGHAAFATYLEALNEALLPLST